MSIQDNDLIGAWELDEMYAEDKDGSRTHPMGRDAGGMIMYTPDHHMSAIVHAAGRFLPADRPTDENRAEAFANYFNYAGSWSLNGDSVTHLLTHALDPNMVGTALTRKISQKAGGMIFTGLGPDGITKQVIIWKPAG
ncbi:MAG: lipocalin-like domain-containing protein [Alphaproteobacteria bacterium]|nr:lipocalin-like domain-containing protein [Alphaproteobacteria bacterium]